MKHLLIDSKGNIYNRYGDIITIGSVSYSMINQYGFELDEIIDKNILIGKKIITYSKKKIKLAIKPKKIIPTVVILNKNLSMYDNIYMNYSMKTFSSYDGKLWASYDDEKVFDQIDKDYYISLCNDAIETITKHGDYYKFVSSDPIDSYEITYNNDIIYKEN